MWDVWFSRGKCEIPRKELLVQGDDSAFGVAPGMWGPS